MNSTLREITVKLIQLSGFVMRGLSGALLGVILFALSALPVMAQEGIILEQEDSPIQIEWYKPHYKSEGRIERISHRVKLSSTGDKQVEAFALGFRIFDAFNRNMDRPFYGYSMDGLFVGVEQDFGWEQTAPNTFIFRRYGTGVTYVAIARLSDGTIWKADELSIQLQLEDLEFDLNEFE